MTSQEIKNLVGENELKEALDALMDLKITLPQQQQVVELQRQLTDLESKSRISLLSYSEENARRTKISMGILSLTDEINHNIHNFSNLKNQEDMEQIVVGFLNQILKSEPAKIIANDLKDAAGGTAIQIWQKFKGLFIEEIDDDAAKIETVKSLNDDKIMEVVQEKLKDEQFRKEVEKVLEEGGKAIKPITRNFRKVLKTYSDAELTELCTDYGFRDALLNFGNNMEKAQKINLLFDYCNKDLARYELLHEGIKDITEPIETYEKNKPYFE